MINKFAIIYKLFCKDKNVKDCYIGSTCNLKKRIIKHKSVCNNSSTRAYNYNLYQCIRLNNGFDSWDFEILEETDYDNRLQRERYHIENTPNTLNKIIPTRTQKEYYIDNKNEIKQYYQDNKKRVKQYYKDNIDKINKRKQTKIYCLCGTVSNKNNISTHKKTKKHIDFMKSMNAIQ